eukprot:1157342-Pelagomonas_calceolata.AAC.4
MKRELDVFTLAIFLHTMQSARQRMRLVCDLKDEATHLVAGRSGGMAGCTCLQGPCNAQEPKVGPPQG